MRVDIMARRWGGPDGGPDGMAIAAAYLAWTLCEIGHDVRGYVGATGAPPWIHPRMDWRSRVPLRAPDDWTADIVISTVAAAWRSTALVAEKVGARDRLVYWHHHGGLLPGMGCLLAAPPAIEPSREWARAVVLPPSSWAAESNGPREGSEILVPGIARPKGGRLSVEVARLCPDLRWYVLPGRSAPADASPWRGLPGVELAPGHVAPESFLARARAVLLPTRAEVHPLTVVEAVARGIPVVCSDLPGCRAAGGEGAIYLPLDAPPDRWAAALRGVLASPLPRVVVPPYRETVATIIASLCPNGAQSRDAPPTPRRPALPTRASHARHNITRRPSPVTHRPPPSGGLPRVLVLADVDNWAWARKARALAHHLRDRIEVTVAIGADHATGPLIESKQHDLYHTFEVVQVGAIPVGYPMVTGITAHVAQAWDARRGAGTVRRWADRALAFHANSRMLQREMEQLLDRPIAYVPNGVDSEFWIRTRPRDGGRLVVGHAARPNPRKGADIVREACSRAGVELRTLDRSSKNALSADEMRDWYQGIHVLAVSSDMDGTPNPALEAASCGCAIVSNRIGNMPEFIVSGDNGLLTERTVDNLADSLAWMAQKPIEYIETMGRSARAHILTDWTWAKRATAYADMWEQCIGIAKREAA